MSKPRRSAVHPGRPMPSRRADKIALLAAPWPIYNRPSIQLGTLKAYLKQTVPELAVDAFHLYLQVAAEVGYARYSAVAERTWLAEPVFAALLYPGKADDARALFQKEARRHKIPERIEFRQFVKAAGTAADRFIAGIDWHAYLLAGFTISLCQLTATLYLTREIKRRCPGLKIVVGGAGAAGESGRALVSAFSWIDAAVQGEGEKPLAGLVRSLREGCAPPAAVSPAVVSAGGAGENDPGRFDQLESLAGLPVPDYDDYFAQLGRLAPAKRFFPVLPVEMSRGCWWQKKLKSGGRGCAFCNLNTQWRGYRSKDPGRMVAELDSLKARYQLVKFAFMDNALPVKTSRALFQKLAASHSDFSFFGEIRAATGMQTLAAMRQGGVEKVQIGIEALSSRMLKKLNKGTTAIENLEVMKHCEELGIENRSNLIVEFPGSDEADVAETLRGLEFATAYRPLKPVRFWLGLGSPVCRDYGDFGIAAHFNHPHYRALFEEDICRNVPLVIQAYRGDRVRQQKLWQPVMRRVRQWEADYGAAMRRNPAAPVLSYRDGGDFIIIREKGADGQTRSHRLAGSSREIYLFCRQRQPLTAITRRHAGFSPQQIKNFLNDMVGKRLMFTEGGLYLSLAVKRR